MKRASALVAACLTIACVWSAVPSTAEPTARPSASPPADATPPAPGRPAGGDAPGHTSPAIPTTTAPAPAIPTTTVPASSVHAVTVPAAPVPAGVEAVTGTVTAILRRNHLDGALDGSTVPPTLSVASLDPLPAADRTIVQALTDDGDLQVSSTGAIHLAGGPRIPEERTSLPTLGTISGNYPDPNIGGIRHYIGTAAMAYACSTAFPVANGFGAFTTTAGHCGERVGDQVWAANGEPNASNVTPYDHVRNTTWGGGGSISSDTAMFSTPNPMPAIRITPNLARVIRGGEDPYLMESNICFRGASTAGERCGGVSKVNTTITAEGRTYPVFCIYRVAGLAGDSGAPMYKKVGTNEARIRGITSVVWDTDGDGEVDTTCGSPISRVLASMSSKLLVA